MPKPLKSLDSHDFPNTFNFSYLWYTLNADFIFLIDFPHIISIIFVSVSSCFTPVVVVGFTFLFLGMDAQHETILKFMPQI